MRIAMLLIAALAISLQGHSESSLYYYADGERIMLHPDHNVLVVHFDPALFAEASRIDLSGLINLEIHEWHGRALLTFDRQVTPADFEPARAIFGEKLYSVAQGLMLDDGFKVALTHDVVAFFGESANPKSAEINALASRHDATYMRDEYGSSIFRAESPMGALLLGNALVENGVAEWAHVDFYAKATKYNDPFYPNQFQMNNTGQIVTGVAGLAGIDCNAAAAWSITTGSPNLTVAVIDDGLEAHEDLVDGNNQTRVLAGHTPVTGGSGTPRFSSDAHGMACAGILAATHNNGKGIRGVAPQVKLRSVNIFWGGETTQNIANGINWARQQGVAVMSNSWGYTSCTVSYSNINNALASAKNNGRGGLGCIVVFASGNGGKTCIDYPANRPEVIAVGAVTSLGAHATYANRGSQLGLVAPSDPNGGQSGGYVATIDRMGSAGYNNGNYEFFFGGTSAACPVVAGVAALLVSVNPNLTEAQVRSTMYNTATDMGAAGFDTTFGHGRVNAGAAVASAAPPCSTNVVTLSITFDNYPAETSWTITDAGDNLVTAGGPYAGQPTGSTINIPICLADGCYTLNFFDSYGDGICCTYGLGSFSLTDGEGELLASGGQFAFSIALPFCLGGPPVEPENCTPINFFDYALLSYGPAGFDIGLALVQQEGTELYQQNNSLKYIPLNYPITPNTILEFEFRSTQQAQMHGIGFNNNNQLNTDRIFKIYGTQSFGSITAFSTYAPSTYQSFSIPVGQYYTGSNLNRLFFLTGNYSGNPRGISHWRNLRVYEAGQCSAFVAPFNQPGLGEAALQLMSNTSRNEGFMLFPNPTRDRIELVSANGDAIVHFRIFSMSGQLIMSESVNAPYFTTTLAHLANGVYFAEWNDNQGNRYREKIIKSQ